MTIENVYKKLNDIYNDRYRDDKDIKNLLSEIENDIKLGTCYKVSKKSRVNAIKKIVKNRGVKQRPFLQGFGVLRYPNNNKIVDNTFVITDSYQLVCIQDDIDNLFNMGLKLVTDDEELINKYGNENVVVSNYPNTYDIIDKYTQGGYYEEVNLDLDYIMSFYKLHNKDKDTRKLYKINNKIDYTLYYDINLLKNVIDIIVKDNDFKCYIGSDKENRPLYIVNSNNEVGIVVPTAIY